MYLHQISILGIKAAETLRQMRRNRSLVPFAWVEGGLVWVEAARTPSLSVGASGAGLAPPRFGDALGTEGKPDYMSRTG